ncbi:MAG: hypothetical protein Q8O17_06715 [Candidatus Methanoperedens sp.]|nr:hypothetical protein [Candidatus Methanoperedens sp.]
MILNKAWIEDWAGRYDESNKKGNILEKEIFESIKEIGSPPSYLTRDILMKISEWKAGIRNKGRIEKNDEQFVRDVTQISLTTHNEELKLEVLTLLSGAFIRMASTILFFCYPERYSVMDYRAWNSLKAFDNIKSEIDDTFDCWQKYNKICREIAKQNGVSLRTLDKALWMYNGDK